MPSRRWSADRIEALSPRALLQQPIDQQAHAIGNQFGDGGPVPCAPHGENMTMVLVFFTRKDDYGLYRSHGEGLSIPANERRMGFLKRFLARRIDA